MIKNPEYLIKITPQLTEDEFKFINDFEFLISLYLQQKNNNRFMILMKNDKNQKFNGEFEIINNKKIKADFNQTVNNFKKKYELKFSEENLMVALDFPEFFVSLNLKEYNSCYYKLDIENSFVLSQLHKLVQVFHQNGIIRQLLNIKFEYHEFNCVVNSYPAYLIHHSEIYQLETNNPNNTQLIQSYNTKKTWGEKQFKNARICIHYENLSLNLKSSTLKTQVLKI